MVKKQCTSICYIIQTLTCSKVITKIVGYKIVMLVKRNGFISGQSHDYKPSTSVSKTSGCSAAVIKAIITQRNYN